MSSGQIENTQGLEITFLEGTRQNGLVTSGDGVPADRGGCNDQTHAIVYQKHRYGKSRITMYGVDAYPELEGQWDCRVTPTIKLQTPFMSFGNGYYHIEWFKQNSERTSPLWDHVQVWFHALLAEFWNDLIYIKKELLTNFVVRGTKWNVIEQLFSIKQEEKEIVYDYTYESNRREPITR